MRERGRAERGRGMQVLERGCGYAVVEVKGMELQVLPPPTELCYLLCYPLCYPLCYTLCYLLCPRYAMPGLVCGVRYGARVRCSSAPSTTVAYHPIPHLVLSYGIILAHARYCPSVSSYPPPRTALAYHPIPCPVKP